MLHFPSFSLPFSQLCLNNYFLLLNHCLPPTWKGIQGWICSSPGELCEHDKGDNYFMERAKNRETGEKQGILLAECNNPRSFPNHSTILRRKDFVQQLLWCFSLLKGTDQPRGSALGCAAPSLGGSFLPNGRTQGSVLVLGVPAGPQPAFAPQGSSRDDTEQRYSSQYEERLDPFSSFSRKV